MTLVEELRNMFPPNEGLNDREAQHQDLGAKAANRIEVLEAALRIIALQSHPVILEEPVDWCNVAETFVSVARTALDGKNWKW